MSDDDPFEFLPDELRNMLESLGGAEAIVPQFQSMMFGGGAPTGPVHWDLARRIAFQIAAEDDRDPTPDEVEAATSAHHLAELWLDEGDLPAPADMGSFLVTRRTGWVDAALQSMRPVVEPVAAASTRAMTELAADQGGFDAAGLPPGLSELMAGMDLGAMMRPVAATMAGMQVGQVVGQLSRTLLGQYDLGIPTAPRATAMHLAVNVHDVFDGWDLDPREVQMALALHEGAHRRLFHAVPWLEAHIHGLVATFANGTRVDPEQLQGIAEELMRGVDPDDPEGMQDAMSRAAEFRLEPTEDQQRVLRRLQGVVLLVGSWARHEAARAGASRLGSLEQISEILRRRRATHSDGEALLARLLGLDLKPDDESVGDSFLETVSAGRGTAGLREALAHPENLPDLDELADPSQWLLRMAAADSLPDDPSALFGDLGDAPVEASAAQRLAEHADGDQSMPSEDPDESDDDSDPWA